MAQQVVDIMVEGRGGGYEVLVATESSGKRRNGCVAASGEAFRQPRGLRVPQVPRVTAHGGRGDAWVLARVFPFGRRNIPRVVTVRPSVQDCAVEASDYPDQWFARLATGLIGASTRDGHSVGDFSRWLDGQFAEGADHVVVVVSEQQELFPLLQGLNLRALQAQGFAPAWWNRRRHLCLVRTTFKVPLLMRRARTSRWFMADSADDVFTDSRIRV